MNWTLEVVVGPVSDVDRAKAFYAKQVGFTVDHDTKVSDEMRVVQLTPRGSGCSMVIGEGIGDMSPGTLQGLQLVVPDLPAARADLIGRGGEGQRDPVARRRFESPRPGGAALDNVGFVSFSDPDGNSWAVQQISARG